MEWKVTYQDTPYTATNPCSMVVEADTVEQAFATAYDFLTRKGLAVYANDCAAREVNVDPLKLRDLIGDHTADGLFTRTHFRRIAPHVAIGLGKVVGQ